MPQYDLTYNPNLARGARLAWTIPASTPAPVTTRVLYASWRNFDNTASPNNASGTINGADWYAGSGNSGPYRASLFVNVTPLTTGEGFLPIAGNTAPAGNYRLTRVGGGLTGNVPGFIEGTIDFRQPDNAGRRAIVVSPSVSATDRSQDMIDAFGTGTPSNGGTWLLERITTTTPSAEDLYRVIRRGTATPNSAPNVDTARWNPITTSAWSNTAAYPTTGIYRTVGSQLFQLHTAISAPVVPANTDPAASADWTALLTSVWDGTAAYPTVGTLVTRGTGNTARLFSSLNAITAPQLTSNPVPSSDTTNWAALTAPTATWSNTAAYSQYTLVNRNSQVWMALNEITAIGGFTEQARWNAGNFGGNGTMTYSGQGGTLPDYFMISYGPLTGSFPTDTSGTWRLRQVGGGTITGAITLMGSVQAGAFRIGTFAQMQAAFGTPHITSGGQWILERESTGTNTAPESDSDNWTQVTAWSGTAAYTANSAVSQGTPTSYFRSINAISAPAVVTAPPNANWDQIAAWATGTDYPQNGYATQGSTLYRATSAVNAESYTRSATNDITFNTTNETALFGATATSSRIYTVINNDEGTSFVWTFNLSGARQSGEDITLGAGSWTGALSTSNRLYFIDDTNNVARAYDHSRVRQASDDITLGTGSWHGGFATSNRLYFINNASDSESVIAYDHSGNRQSADDVLLGLGNWQGGLATSTRIFVVEAGSGVSATAHAYDLNGNTLSSENIDLGSGPRNGGFVTTNRMFFTGATSGVGNTETLFAYNITLASNPSVDTANWTAVTPPAWTSTTHTQGDVVSQNNAFYQANKTQHAPSATTYTEVARYNDSATNGKRVSGGAAYHSIPELCVNHTAAMGDFPSDTSGMFRLRYVPGGSATQAAASMTGNLTVLFEGNTANPYRCIRVGSIANFTATFGVGSSNATDNSPARFFGGTWILERVTQGGGGTNTAPESDSTNWSEVVFTDWSATAAYQQNAVTRYQTAFYRANGAISAPANVITEQARWKATMVAVSQSARYVHTTGIIVASNNALSGGFPSDTSGLWRISQVGGSSTAFGALTVIPSTDNNVRFRVGSQANMIAVFGSVEIASGGNFVLEREEVPAQNPTPANDHQHWTPIETPAWDANTAYPQSAYVRNGTPVVYYQSSQEISAPTANMIVRRSALISGDRIMWQYDSDAAQGSRLSFREVS